MEGRGQRVEGREQRAEGRGGASIVVVPVVDGTLLSQPQAELSRAGEVASVSGGRLSIVDVARVVALNGRVFFY